MGKEIYSLGLYIDECPRMRYKGGFKNSEIFCHTTHQFYPIDSVRDLLAERSMCLERDATKLEEALAKLKEKRKYLKSSSLILEVDPESKKLNIFNYDNYKVYSKRKLEGFYKEYLNHLPSRQLYLCIDYVK